MEVKMWECERETCEEEHKEDKDSVHFIVFTAGTFLLMVCLKRFLVEEQWRAWVFLVLNVILLAILLMSMKPGLFRGQSSEESGESNVEEVMKSDKKEKKVMQENEEGKECIKKQFWGGSTNSIVHAENEVIDEVVEEEEEEEEQVLVLSKEELNERVEAFIAMFRKHLRSDVKENEDFRLQKTSNLATKIEVPCC